MSRGLARDVWLKLEALQPPGSFKIRGLGHACEAHARRGARRFISSSGGNAGIAIAYAGQKLGIPVSVVVPETTTERAISLMRHEGADVTVHGASWQEANELALSMVTDVDTFLHPFDNPLLWEGHASMIDEVAAAAPKPDVVVVSVGGGGLLCGVAEGLRRNDWEDVPIVAAETVGADSFSQAVLAGRPVELPGITSIATSLGARQVCQQALEWTSRLDIRNEVVTDSVAVDACQRFLDDHRILVEPACGAALSVVYNNLAILEEAESVLVIVCGGAVTTAEQLRTWQAA